MQLPTVNRILRPSVSRRKSPGLAPNELAEFVEIAQPPGGNANLGELVAEPQLGQLAHRCGLHIDADAQWAQLRDRLIDAHPDARLVQAQRQTEPANPAPDNNDLHPQIHLPAVRMSLTASKVANSTFCGSPFTFSTLRM